LVAVTTPVENLGSIVEIQILNFVAVTTSLENLINVDEIPDPV